METPGDLRDFAIKTITAAGTIANKYFRQDIEVSSKTDIFDPVTIADREIEHYIRDQIRQAYPEHSITGEEDEDYTGASDYRWVIDPIDGTRSFISGIPIWGILLGLQSAGQTILGLMYQPFTNELYVGDESGTFLYQGESSQGLSVRTDSTLGSAIITTTHPDHIEDKSDLEAFLRLAAECKLSRYGGDCYAYCLLASGHIDLVVETGLMAYDIMPLLPIIENAGGIISNWEGESVVDGGRVIAAANADLHTQALNILTSR
jgi:myo-inositol-1(or 4)-monophosphatase